MKIERVEALHLRLPEVKLVADGTQDVLIVRVHTDDGRVGQQAKGDRGDDTRDIKTSVL